MDIVVWLRSLGLGKYEAAFRENDIDETVLPGLTHETLKELGVASVGHRVKVLADDAILLARQFCDCLRDRVDDFIRFISIDFLQDIRRRDRRGGLRPGLDLRRCGIHSNQRAFAGIGPKMMCVKANAMYGPKGAVSPGLMEPK